MCEPIDKNINTCARARARARVVVTASEGARYEKPKAREARGRSGVGRFVTRTRDNIMEERTLRFAQGTNAAESRVAARSYPLVHSGVSSLSTLRPIGNRTLAGLAN